MRETYRLNKDKFPGTGALLFILKSCNNEEQIKEEMFRLSAEIVNRANEQKSANQNVK